MTRIAYVALDSAEHKRLAKTGWKEVHRLDVAKNEVQVKMVLPDTNFNRLVADGEGRN